jgi:hypothetical protein
LLRRHDLHLQDFVLLLGLGLVVVVGELVTLGLV